MQSCQMFPRRRQLKRDGGVTVASSLTVLSVSRNSRKYISDFTWPTKRACSRRVCYNTKFRDPTISCDATNHSADDTAAGRSESRDAARASLTLSCPRLPAEHTQTQPISQSQHSCTQYCVSCHRASEPPSGGVGGTDGSDGAEGGAEGAEGAAGGASAIFLRAASSAAALASAAASARRAAASASRSFACGDGAGSVLQPGV